MLPFSINYLTGSYSPYSNSDVGTYSEGGSPTSTESSSVFNRSSGSPDSSFSDSSLVSPDSIAEVMKSLEKQARNIVNDHDTGRPSPSNSPNDDGEKPPHSYIALISMVILSSPDRRMLLGDIYQYIMDNFSYYNNKVKAWRNSIRHNLSLNECFIKNGRADNGKGHFWSIHPACVEDFAKGDFHRRQARRRARKTTKDIKATQLPVGYGYNTGYVQMTSSSVGHHPYQRSVPNNLEP